MNTGMTIDSESLRVWANNLITQAQLLNGMIDVAEAKIEQSKQVYDSPSAEKFRVKMDSFAANAKKGIEESFQAIADAFSTVAQISDTTEEDISREADKYLTTELFEDVGI